MKSHEDQRKCLPKIHDHNEKTYPILLLVHERPQPYAGPEVRAAVVAILAVIALRAVQGMIVQIEFASLAIPAMVQGWRNLRAIDAIVGINVIIVVAFIFALDLVYVNVDLGLRAEKAES